MVLATSYAAINFHDDHCMWVDQPHIANTEGDGTIATCWTAAVDIPKFLKSNSGTSCPQGIMFRATIILLLSKELIKLRVTVMVIAQVALDSSIEATKTIGSY